MANITADDIVEQAFGRLGELNGEYPSTRGPMYVRIGIRQRELYARAAHLNAERYGACMTGNLSSGNADLNDVASPTPVPELIQRIEIANAGTSGYAVGAEVTIVTPEDQSATFAPRCMIRDGVVIGVGTDLALVTSIKIFYGKLPDLILATGGTTVLALTGPWDSLLEADLCRWLVAKATALTNEKRVAALAAIGAEEKELLTAYDAHVVGYTPTVSRFYRPRISARGAE